MSGRATVLLVGLDTLQGQCWTWRWGEETRWRSPHRVDAAGATRVGHLLAEAIPGTVPVASSHQVPCSLGALAHPDTEWALAAHLADILFPPALARELIDRAAHGRVQLRVHPSTSTAAVPWELLPVGRPYATTRRLLDLADVIHIAPLLPRDSDPGRRVRPWPEVRQQPPLLVIDPDLTGEGIGRVLSATERDAWREAHPESVVPRRGRPASLIGMRTDRRWLARALPGRSRFLFLGHVVATSDAASAGLLLGCRPSDYAADQRTPPPRVRPFTAVDALRGTLDADALTGDPDRCRARFGVPQVGAGNVPDAAWDTPRRRVLPVPGRHLWPMPPRVAIIGCRSGSDVASAEPFGLVTAFLELGAELVTATRWTLFTARSFSHWGCLDNPLAAAARAVDRCHELDDPVTALAGWQRTQLHAWRTTGALRHTPLVWAALASYDGTPRRITPSYGRE